MKVTPNRSLSPNIVVLLSNFHKRLPINFKNFRVVLCNTLSHTYVLAFTSVSFFDLKIMAKNWFKLPMFLILCLTHVLALVFSAEY